MSVQLSFSSETDGQAAGKDSSPHPRPQLPPTKGRILTFNLPLTPNTAHPGNAAGPNSSRRAKGIKFHFSQKPSCSAWAKSAASQGLGSEGECRSFSAVSTRLGLLPL
jgi:hypothetical protein